MSMQGGRLLILSEKNVYPYGISAKKSVMSLK